MSIHYAIEIDTQSGITDSSLAIVSGIIRVITDRPGYDGTPTYPLWEDDTNNTNVWYEGFLLRSGVGLTSRRVDISVGGDYGTLSGFNCSITNDQKFWSLLEASGIYLTNRKIVVYTVIDNKFFYSWSGLIANNPYNETDYSFVCKDNFSTAHDDFPPEVISNTNYPGVKESNIGRSIPVCMGNVPFAELLDVGDSPVFVELMEDASSTPHEAAAAIDYVMQNNDEAYLDLYTLNKTFTANYFSGGNYYLLAVAGGGVPTPDTEILIPITGNDATSSEITRVYLGFPIPILDRGEFNPAGTVNTDGVKVLTAQLQGSTTLLTDGYSWGGSPGTLYANARFTINTGGNESQEYVVQGDTTITHVGLGNDQALITLDRPLDNNVNDNDVLTFQVLAYVPAAPIANSIWWYFKIVEIAVEKVVSYREIQSFKNDTDLYPIILRYNDEIKSYDSLYNIAKSTDETNARIGITTDKMDIETTLKNTYPLVPESVEVLDITVAGSATPSTGTVANLIDRDRTTSYDWSTTGNNIYGLRFWTNSPNTLSVENVFDTLYAALDLDFSFGATLLTIDIKFIYQDVYGKDLTNGPTNSLTVNLSSGTLNYLPNSYYNLGGNDNSETSSFGYTKQEGTKVIRINDYFKIEPALIEAIRKHNNIRRFGFEITFNLSGVATGTIDLKQVGMIGEQEVNLKDDELYIKCRGEYVTIPDIYFGDATTTIDIIGNRLNYVSGTDPAFNYNGLKAGDTFVINISGYAGNGSYTVERVLPVTSTIDFTTTLITLIGTAIGSSTALKSENPERQVDTVYRAFKHIMENYDGIPTSEIEYNNLPDVRDDWEVARQVTERRNSMDYLRELCMHSFVCIYPTRDGKRGLKAWIEDTYSVAAHTPAKIDRASITSFTKTKIEKLYNDFTINYSFSPGSDRYERTLFITRITESAFPGPAEVEDGELKWKRFVGGLDSSLYNEAKVLWDGCHLAYNRMKNVTELPAQFADIDWYYDPAIFDGDASDGATIDESVYKYLSNMVQWATLQKDVVEYSLPITSTNITLELLNRISFNDTIYTDSITRGGYITKLEIEPKIDKIHIQLILDAESVISEEIEDTYTSQESYGWADWEDTYTSQEPTNADIEDSYA